MTTEIVDQEIERRTCRFGEIRTVMDGKTPKIVGHAIVFDSLSEDLGGFRECVKDDVIIHGGDVHALLNHNPDFVLGRSTNGTLRYWKDSQGLAVEINPPATQWAKDLLVSIGRGDVSQMSFGFRCIADEWSRQDGHQVRTLKEIELYDVSPVTYPAYPETDLAARRRAASMGSRSAGPTDTKTLNRRLKTRALELEMSNSPEGQAALQDGEANQLRKRKREIDYQR